MSKFARAVAILALALTGPASAQSWAEYRPAGVGYRIEMPGTPQVSSEDVSTALGPIKNTTALIDKGSVAFLVSHNDYPKDAMARSTPDKLLDGVRDGHVGKEGKLISEQRLTMNKSPARRMLIQKGDQIVFSQIALGGVRLYQAVYVGPLGTEKDADVKRFLDSFAIVAR